MSDDDDFKRRVLRHQATREALGKLWIDCTDEMPPMGLSVLTFCPRRPYIVGHWSGEGWRDDCHGGAMEVSHWMPWPEPPPMVWPEGARMAMPGSAESMNRKLREATDG